MHIDNLKFKIKQETKYNDLTKKFGIKLYITEKKINCIYKKYKNKVKIKIND